MRRERPASRVTDQAATAQARTHDTVMVEHRVPIFGHPDIAFDAGSAEAQSQRERFERVLGRVRPCAPVCESNGYRQWSAAPGLIIDSRMSGHSSSPLVNRVKACSFGVDPLRTRPQCSHGGTVASFADRAQEEEPETMTKIRAHCPTCGDVEFGVDAIVVVAAGAEGVVARTYRFSCPSCAESVSRSALPEVIDLLVTAGVAVDLGARHNAERVDARPGADGWDRSRRGAPPLSAADLEEFRRELAAPDWFDKLRR